MAVSETTVRNVSFFIGIAVAYSAKVFGRNRNWLPVEREQETRAFRITMALAGLAIAGLWYISREGQHATELFLTAGLLLVLTIASYLALRNVLHRFTFRRQKATGEWIPIIGGFQLTPEAQAISAEGKSTQDIFRGAAFNRDKVWTRASQSNAESVVMGLYILMFACGSTGLAAMGFAISDAI